MNRLPDYIEINEENVKISHIKSYVQRNNIEELNLNFISDSLVCMSKKLSDFDFFDAFASLGDCFIKKSKDYFREGRHDDSINTLSFMISVTYNDNYLEAYRNHYIFIFFNFIAEIDKKIRDKKITEKYIEAIIMNSKFKNIYYDYNNKVARIYLSTKNYDKFISSIYLSIKEDFEIKLSKNLANGINNEESFRNALHIYGGNFQSILNNFNVTLSYKIFDDMHGMFIIYKDKLSLSDFSLICYEYSYLGLGILLQNNRYDEAILFTDYCTGKNIFPKHEDTRKEWLLKIDKSKNKPVKSIKCKK